MRDDEMEKVLRAMRAADRRRREREVQCQVLAVCLLLMLIAMLVGACWAASLSCEIGTNLPLAPYSIDEATGEVLK